MEFSSAISTQNQIATHILLKTVHDKRRYRHQIKRCKMAKKQKTSTDWVITFDQTQSLRSLVDVVCNILTRINIRMRYDSEKEIYQLCIDSIDPRHVCMIQARLVVEKSSNTNENIEFCIDSALFNNCLKSIPPHYSLDIKKSNTNADIVICAYESLSNSHSLEFRLNTLVDEEQVTQLTDMTYRYTVEIDLCTLRQIVKMSQTLKSDSIELSIEEPCESEKSTNHMLFAIRANGEAQLKHSFHSATIKETSSNECVIRAVTDSASSETTNCDMTLKYSASFSSQYVNLFLKSMERQVITMKLSEDKPLILFYPLGGENSHICFVLAPKTPEE